MTLFQHVLAPTDFSTPARAALETAIVLSEKFGAKLTLLHVVEPPFTALAESREVAALVEHLERAAHAALDEAARAVEQRVAVTTSLRRGQVWREILEGAHACGADLIVLSTHGKTGLARALVGGVTDKVVRLSPVRVLTVHGLTTLA